MIINALIISLCFYSSANQTSALSVDWAAFNYDNGMSLVEVYYSCPYNILHYAVKNDTIIAPYKISFRLKSIDGQDSLKETIIRRAIIPSFETAQHRDMKLVDGFGFFAQPGRYWFNMTLEESLFVSSFTDTIEVPDFTKSPVLSAIELASSVIHDTTGGKFTKGKMRIMPNPETNYGHAYELMYIYIEGYNLSNDTFPYELSYKILSEAKISVKSFPNETKNKTGTSFAYTFAVNTKGLMPGKYFLEITLKDNGTDKYDAKEKAFWVISKPLEEKTVVSSIPAIDTSNYATELRFITTPSELHQYNSLNDVGKIEFLHRFWGKNDLDEFTRRIKFADDKYNIGRVSGRETDRGRIYIKYGQPDEVTVHTMIEHTKPHEHWYYYSKGFHFIFIDIRGNNNFQLIYSNADAEPKNQNWEKYVDPLELDDLE